jgi:hypothetical protein
VHGFTPMAMSGIVVLSSESIVADDQGANFGPELSVLANCFKPRFGRRTGSGQAADDAPFIHTVTGKTLAQKRAQPRAIEGKGAELG